MSAKLAAVSLLVRDYFTAKLGFALVGDTAQVGGKRWVVVAPERSAGTQLVLARGEEGEQRSLIGRQGGGRLWRSWKRKTLPATIRRWSIKGVRPRVTPSRIVRMVAVFEDLSGNKWDLLQRSV